MFINNLLNSKYLIPVTLHHKLFEAHNAQRSNNVRIVKDDGFYLISLRTFNYNKNIMLYNYLYYDIDFVNIILASILSRNIFNGRENGRYLVVVDSSLQEILDHTEFKLDSHIIKNNDSNIFIDYGDLKQLYHKKLNLFDLFSSIFKLTHFTDNTGINKLIDASFTKNYSSLMYSLFGHENIIENNKNLRPNILNNTIFVVRDLKSLLNSLKSSGYIIDSGDNQSKGTLNSNTQFLSGIDNEYRRNMFNHYNSFKYNINHHEYKYTLKYKHFSFRNVHVNLGQVRWNSTLVNENKRNRQILLDDSFNLISDIIKNNSMLSKADLQLKIENFLFNQEDVFRQDQDYKNVLNFSEEGFKLLEKKKSDIIKILSNINVNKTKNKTYSSEYTHWIEKIINELGHAKVCELLISYFMQILSKETTCIDDVEAPGIPTITAFHTFGVKIFNRYIYSLYINSEEFKQDKKLTLNQYVYRNKAKFSDMYVENFYARFAGYFINMLLTVELLEEDLDFNPSDSKESIFYLRINRIIRSILLKVNFKSFHLPVKLPMICKPKEYVYSTEIDKNILGGYLLNDIKYIDYIFKNKMGYDKNTVINEKNNIIDLINGLSSTPYKVNNDTLDYIYKYGIEKNIIIDSNTKDIIEYMRKPYDNRTKTENKRLRSLVSKIIQEKNILNIASVYSNIDKIYFPVRLDQRTRIYCETDYFHYQSNDLAKGLISFADPGIIYKHDREAIKYFKAFGANMYGENLDKKSLNYRVKWVDDNSDKLLDFENNNIVDKSENKTCFISFCFEYRRFIEFMNNKNKVKFNTYLPIQLDASCNCYQHLVLLTKESNLLNKLNLDSSTHDDTPNDFYTYVLEQSQIHITRQIDQLSKIKERTIKQDKQLNSLMLLDKLQFNRSLVKKVIMTKSYSATIPKQVSLLAEGFNELSLGRERFYTYKDDPTKIKRSDLVTFVMVLKDVINIISPRIKELSEYLDSIVLICTRLSIPVPWVLPSGAKIYESYLIEKKLNIKAFSFVKSRYTFKKYESGYDLAKQKRATMPNLIHSLDATSIAMLYQDFKPIGSLYTVHDCFAVTSNNVPKLVSSLKWVYMRLYSDESYLLQFDKLLRWTINSTFGDETFKIDGDVVNILHKNKNTKIQFPNVLKVLNINNEVSDLQRSAYLII